MESLVYVGMDVHKETISIAALRDYQTATESELTIRNEPSAIKKFFSRLCEKGGTVLTCYEAGPTGFEIYRQLEKLEIHCLVVAPSMLPRQPGDKIKTDKRDAVLLAKALRNNQVSPVYIPSTSDESVRDYLRMVDNFKDTLKRTKQRLTQFLLRHGHKYDPTRKRWTNPHKAWLKSIQFKEELDKLTLVEFNTQIGELEEKILRFNDKIKELATRKCYKERVEKLRCFKGIDTLTAISFVTEIGDFRRFSTAQGFMNFLGLVPSVYSTGAMRRSGSITKAGNKRLRKLLIEAGHHYRSYHSDTKRLIDRRRGQDATTIAYANKAGRRLNKKYRKMIFHNKMVQVTVTSVARELSGFIWGMMVGKTA